MAGFSGFAPEGARYTSHYISWSEGKTMNQKALLAACLAACLVACGGGGVVEAAAGAAARPRRRQQSRARRQRERAAGPGRWNRHLTITVSNTGAGTAARIELGADWGAGLAADPDFRCTATGGAVCPPDAGSDVVPDMPPGSRLTFTAPVTLAAQRAWSHHQQPVRRVRPTIRNWPTTSPSP
jgi:hypothetical protein